MEHNYGQSMCQKLQTSGMAYYCWPVLNTGLTLKLLGPAAGVSEISDSYCSLKPLWSGLGEVVPARTSPPLHPHPLQLCCDYPV